MYNYVKALYRKFLLNSMVSNNDIKALAQKDYCEKHKLPCFAPSDGRCWSCAKPIYSVISLVVAAGSLITGCPYCHRSYCD